MKKWIAMMLALLLVCSAAMAGAEGLAGAAARAQTLANKVGGTLAEETEQAPIQQEAAIEQPAAQEAPLNLFKQPAAPVEATVTGTMYGKPVLVEAEGFELVRSSEFATYDYVTEATILAEIRNMTGDAVLIDQVTLNAVNAAGETVHTSPYVSVAYAPVENGESFYVNDWLYAYVDSLDDVDHYVLTIEVSEYNHFTKKPVPYEAKIQGDYVYLYVTNEEPIRPMFEVTGELAVSDAQGRLIHAEFNSTYNSVGIAPGSTLIFRTQMRNYEGGISFEGVTVEAQAYQLDYTY